GDGAGDVGDVPHLVGEVAGHVVDVVGELLPDAGDVGDVRLTAEHAVGADLARHAGDLVGERAERGDHGVDRVLQREDLALDLDGAFPPHFVSGDGAGDVGDVADLVGEVPGHVVDVVGELLPDAGDVLDVRLHAQGALG